MAKERELPPPLEMACLNALWELGEGNVEEVRVCVSRGRPLAYTTVLTLLDRLSHRGAVSRRKEGRGFRYQPSIERDRLRRIALSQFLDHHFDGSVASLRIFLEGIPLEGAVSEVVVLDEEIEVKPAERRPDIESAGFAEDVVQKLAEAQNEDADAVDQTSATSAWAATAGTSPAAEK